MSQYTSNKALFKLPLFLFFLILVACTTLPQEEVGIENLEPTAESKVIVTKEKSGSVPERTSPKRPNIELSEDILYKILLAEIAGQRGKINIAVDNYLDLARTTLDPVVIERATRMSVYAGNTTAAYEAANLWIEVDPVNPDAHQVLTVITLRKGNIDKALYHLEIVL